MQYVKQALNRKIAANRRQGLRMVDFKKLLEQRANEASKLPSFPMKGATYAIDIKNPDLSSYEDFTEQQGKFGMIKRKQTLFRLNAMQDGKAVFLRLSANQVQQLSKLLATVEINDDTKYVTVKTTEGDTNLLFYLPRDE